MIILLGALFFDILYGIPVYIIAKKSEHQYSWFAFIPLANLWLMCDMADVELYWLAAVIVAGFIPFIGGLAALVFNAVIWMRLAENAEKPSWYGVLMDIPVVNLVVGYYIAFA